MDYLGEEVLTHTHFSACAQNLRGKKKKPLVFLEKAGDLSFQLVKNGSQNKSVCTFVE